MNYWRIVNSNIDKVYEIIIFAGYRCGSHILQGERS